MPNHCFQTLSVTGPIEDVKRFHDKVTAPDNDGIARAYLPFPEKFQGEGITDKEGNVIGRVFTEEGYRWALDTWGTKWGDYDTEVVSEPAEVQGEGHASYQFSSAWSPMERGIFLISEKEPTLTFFISYKEEGNAFVGATAFRNGEVLGHHDIEDPKRFPDVPDNDEHWDDYYDALNELQQECEDAVAAQYA